MVVGFRNPWPIKLAERHSRNHLNAQVSEPDLRANLLPDFRFGCKRVLISDDYLRASTSPTSR